MKDHAIIIWGCSDDISGAAAAASWMTLLEQQEKKFGRKRAIPSQPSLLLPSGTNQKLVGCENVGRRSECTVEEKRKKKRRRRMWHFLWHLTRRAAFPRSCQTALYSFSLPHLRISMTHSGFPHRDFFSLSLSPKKDKWVCLDSSQFKPLSYDTKAEQEVLRADFGGEGGRS